MPKPNKQAYLDFILNELNKGNVQYKDVCSVFCSKFQLTERTFNNYWLKANEVYKEQRKTVNEAKVIATIEQEKNEVKRAIIDKFEALEILSDIAKGKAKRVDGQIIMPSPSEQRQAIDSIAKMQGWNSPIESELKVVNIPPIQWVK